MTIEWILGIVASLFGGLNIFQFVYWRAEKKKHEAEAESASVDAKQKEIDLQQDQFDYLIGKLTKYQEDYYALAEQLQQELRKHTEVINQKCNEIAELKSKIVYFKGLRCYRSECPKRIRLNPKDGETVEGNTPEAY